VPPSPTAVLSIPDLQAQLAGRVIAPGDDDYDRARTVMYGGPDARPAVIVRVAGEADVARVVGLARETGLELAVRSGGHSAAATARPMVASFSTCRR
jgi:FAD/FMN-containing dehydrogenase